MPRFALWRGILLPWPPNAGLVSVAELACRAVARFYLRRLGQTILHFAHTSVRIMQIMQSDGDRPGRFVRQLPLLRDSAPLSADKIPFSLVAWFLGCSSYFLNSVPFRGQVPLPIC